MPGFDGILLHCGNSEADTAGCILVGSNTAVGRLTQSQAAFTALMARLRQPLTITIEQ